MTINPFGTKIEFTCIDQYSAIAVADSEKDLKNWWSSIESKKPFDQLMAERPLEGRLNECVLSVRMGFKNQGVKISQIFEKLFVTYKSLPPVNLVDFILENLDKTYQIQGRSYQITELISSQGCYGDVFLARDQGSNNNVVIKILRTESDREDLTLQMIAQNGGHPNIVQYIASDVILGKRWIVMEHVEGVVRAKYQGSWTEDLETQYQSALSFMRDSGITTVRENEKENIIISSIDQVPVIKLIDFGTLSMA